MAESLVFVVLQKIAVIVGQEVVRTGISKLCREVSELRDIQDNVKKIQREFDVMQGFLRKVDVQASSDQCFERWLEHVRMVAYDVEDIIDEYAYLMGQKRNNKTVAKKLVFYVKKGKTWLEISTQIKEISGHLDHLTQMRGRYGITIPAESRSNSSNANRLPNKLDYSNLVDENEIVGHSAERKQLIQWLTKSDRDRAIISVWGMGGLGKTTLVSGIYKAKKIKDMFDCCAFISFSQTFEAEDLLRSTIKQILDKEGKHTTEYDRLDRASLEEAIHSKLQNKRYFIVLDDVWRRDAWLSLSQVFPKNNKGSRVVITTRIEDVARLADGNWLIRMGPLSKVEALALFYRKAFGKLEERSGPREFNGWSEKIINRCQGLYLAFTRVLLNKKKFGSLSSGTCPQELVGWAEKIIDRCQGLPLAIVAIGSLLSFRGMEETQWRFFYNQLSWELSNNSDLSSVANVLNLSYDNLPTYLKNCFLYCSLFPEDYLIPRKWIIRLMIAEGFIEDRGPGATMEEVAESYLVELAHRSLLQVVERNVYGRAKRFRMHDLVRSMCISKAKCENFGIGCDNQLSPLDWKARRIIIHNMSKDLPPSVELSKLRSLLFFGTQQLLPGIKGALENLRLLRVLSLRGCYIESLPEVVFELFNLHYLDVAGTNVKVLPKSLGKLKLLETLDLRFTFVEKLPSEVTDLRKLRHLFSYVSIDDEARQYDSFIGLSVTPNICNLRDLITLRCIEANDDIVKGLQRLEKLRNLSLSKVKASHIGDLWFSIRKIRFLSALGIIACDKDETLNLQNLDPMPGLEKLYLKGKLEGGIIPSIFSSFTKMRELKLVWLGLREDPLSSFSHMSNLVQLHLYRIFEGSTLTFRSGWFPKLQMLFLADLFELVCIDFEDGTMGSLHYMNLIGLSKLTRVPEGIRCLRTLRKLILTDMPDQFMGNLREIEWRDLSRISFFG